MIENASCASPCRHPKLVSMKQPIGNDEWNLRAGEQHDERGENQTCWTLSTKVGVVTGADVVWKDGLGKIRGWKPKGLIV